MNVYDMNKVLYELFRHSVVTGAHGYRRHWRWLDSEHSWSMTGLRTI